MSKISKTVLATLCALLMSVSTATSASAADRTEAAPPDTKPDRIILVGHAAPQVQGKLVTAGDGSVKPDVVGDDDFPVVPAPGETVRLIYTDAVTDVTTRDSSSVARASCTESKTVKTPYKASNAPRVEGYASISSGCGGGATFKIVLYGALGTRGNTSAYVPNNGSSVNVYVAGATCTYGWDAGYYGIGTFSGSGATQGPTATLPCNY